MVVVFIVVMIVVAVVAIWAVWAVWTVGAVVVVVVAVSVSVVFRSSVGSVRMMTLVLIAAWRRLFSSSRWFAGFGVDRLWLVARYNR